MSNKYHHAVIPLIPSDSLRHLSTRVSLHQVKTFPISAELGKDKETVEMLGVDRARCQERPAWHWEGVIS